MTDKVRDRLLHGATVLRARAARIARAYSPDMSIRDGDADALASFAEAVVEALAASPQGGGLQRRVDLNNGGTLEEGGHVDDLSISGEYISLLRLERMNRGSFWGRIYMKDGQDIVLSISAPKGKIDVTAEADQGLPVSPQGEGSSAGQDALIEKTCRECRALHRIVTEGVKP